MPHIHAAQANDRIVGSVHQRLTILALARELWCVV
jgi:hypothetical protein